LASINRFSKQWVQRSAQRETVDPIKELGSQLFSALFEGSIGEAYRVSLGHALSKGTPWRLRLTMRDGTLASLPWEFLYDGRDFIGLSAQASVVRQCGEAPFAPRPVTDRVRVLFVTAGVGEMGPGIDREIEIVKSVGNSDRMRLTIVQNATPEQFRTQLGKESYDVLIFSGTANLMTDWPWDDSQALVLMGESGQRSQMTREQIIEALRPQENLRLIYLSACNSDRLAGALSNVAHAAVGMRGEVTEDACMVFTGRLLEAALDGLWLDEAVAHGRRAIDLQDPGNRGWGMPVFYLSTPDGVGVRLCEPRVPGPVASSPKPRAARSDNRPRRKLPSRDKDEQRRLEQLEALFVVHQQNLSDLQKQIESYSEPAPAFLLEQLVAAQTKTSELQKQIAEMT
jgi:hypothetical protein